MLTLVGTALVLVGLLLMILGVLGFILAAFRESLLWGLGVIFVPPLALVFLIVHWRRVKPAVIIKLWGLVLVMLGAWIADNGLPWPIG
jgi:hypothetical protein